jgi:ubiquinone biosynthesis protein COQ9
MTAVDKAGDEEATLARRREILAAVLPHVVFDGWSARAWRAGLADCALEPWEGERYFPAGAADVVRFFSAEADRAMLETLKDTDLSTLKVRERVATAVRLRLEAVADHPEAVRRGLSFFAFPGHAARGLACLYGTVDAIWHGVGDRSTDYNFYSKRLLLAGVYSATLVFWLDDGSEDKAASWAFLDRRIGEVLKIGGRFGKTFGKLLQLPERLFTPRFPFKVSR